MVGFESWSHLVISQAGRHQIRNFSAITQALHMGGLFVWGVEHKALAVPIQELHISYGDF